MEGVESFGDVVLVDSDVGSYNASTAYSVVLGAEGLALQKEQNVVKAVLSAKKRMMLPMLNDSRRNEVFRSVIVSEVENFIQLNGHGPRVLDIGAGTGLLSLMAAKAGALVVVACEMNPALALVAQETVHENGMDAIVRVEAIRSTGLVLDTETDKFDMVITETLDSDLLSEGIVESLAHAIKELCKPDPVVIPHSARVFAFACRHELGNFGTRELRVCNGKICPTEKRSTRITLPGDNETIVLDGETIASIEKGRVSQVAEIFNIDFRRALELSTTRDFKENVSFECSSVANSICIFWELSVSSNSERGKRRKIDSLLCNFDPKEEYFQRHWFPVLFPLQSDGTKPRVDFVRLPDKVGAVQLNVEFGTFSKSVPFATTAFEHLLRMTRSFMVSADEKWDGEGIVVDVSDSSTFAWQICSKEPVVSLQKTHQKEWKALLRTPSIRFVSSLEEIKQQKINYFVSNLYYEDIGAKDEIASFVRFQMQVDHFKVRKAFPEKAGLVFEILKCGSLAKSSFRVPKEIEGFHHRVRFDEAESVLCSRDGWPVEETPYVFQLSSTNLQPHIPITLPKQDLDTIFDEDHCLAVSLRQESIFKRSNFAHCFFTRDKSIRRLEIRNLITFELLS